MNDPVSTQKHVDFALNVFKLEGTISDVTYRIQSTGSAKSVAYSKVAQTPTGGPGVPTYTFSETIIGWDGTTETTADSNIFNFAASGTAIEIATSDTANAKSYGLALRSEANERTSVVHYMGFQAHLFSFTAQANDYQVYIVGNSEHKYNIKSPVLVSDHSFTKTCTLY